MTTYHYIVLLLVCSRALPVKGNLLRGQSSATLLLEQEEESKKPISFPKGLLGGAAFSASSSSSIGLWDYKEKIVRNTYYYYEEHVVSSSPTRDLCYGNMERIAYKKFCHSEMPSVSLEPSEQPTAAPNNDHLGNPWDNNPTLPKEPTLLPTGSPNPSLLVPSSRQPSSTSMPPSSPAFPTDIPLPAGIGLCAGDCDSPADCESGLYCFQRMNFEAVPGCPGTERDESRTDYCTNTTSRPSPLPPPPPPTTDDDSPFRLKLYWNASYWWQESNEEIEWCMACLKQDPSVVSLHPSDERRPPCQEGDALFLHYCSNEESVVYFDFDFVVSSNISSGQQVVEWLMQITGTDLCLELQQQDTGATLQVCNATNPLQHWTSPPPPSTTPTTDDEPFFFEITPQRPSHDTGMMDWDNMLCLTTHHHPKLGEEVELYPCDVARHDNSSLWIMF